MEAAGKFLEDNFVLEVSLLWILPRRNLQLKSSELHGKRTARRLKG
jgi:hypothetical protein